MPPPNLDSDDGNGDRDANGDRNANGDGDANGDGGGDDDDPGVNFTSLTSTLPVIGSLVRLTAHVLLPYLALLLLIFASVG